jgi:hypothetical protein
MHRFALVAVDAMGVSDRLGQGARREVDRARRLEPPTVPTPHGISYFPWSV